MSKIVKSHEAIVLKNINYKDTDKIYSLFVRDLGKISAKARGVRKFSSKRLSFLDSLNIVKIGIVGDHDIKTLTEVSLVNSFRGIKSDFNKLKSALYIIEIVSLYLNESPDYEELYQLMVKCLLRLEETSYSDTRIENYFEFQFLKLTGYELNFSYCSFCNSTVLDKSNFTFNYEKGSLVCSDCSSSSNYFSKNNLKSFLMFNHVKVSDQMEFFEVDKILKNYIDQVLPLAPKTSKFFR